MRYYIYAEFKETKILCHSSGGEGTGVNLNDEGFVNLDGSGDNGAGSTPPQEATFTIKWNGQKENLVLQP